MKEVDSFGDSLFEQAMREARRIEYDRMAREEAVRRKFERGDVDGIIRSGAYNFVRKEYLKPSAFRSEGSKDKGKFN